MAVAKDPNDPHGIFISGCGDVEDNMTIPLSCGSQWRQLNRPQADTPTVMKCKPKRKTVTC